MLIVRSFERALCRLHLETDNDYTNEGSYERNPLVVGFFLVCLFM
jgi:hypothetical protein